MTTAPSRTATPTIRVPCPTCHGAGTTPAAGLQHCRVCGVSFADAEAVASHALPCTHVKTHGAPGIRCEECAGAGEVEQEIPLAVQEADVREEPAPDRGRAAEAIEAIIEERASIEARAEKAEAAGDAKGGRPQKGSDNPPLPKGSTSAARLTARIARDRPDILERMKAGEFPSVRAAAREAGIVRDATPGELLQRAWRRASDEERQAFLLWTREV